MLFYLEFHRDAHGSTDEVENGAGEWAWGGLGGSWGGLGPPWGTELTGPSYGHVLEAILSHRPGVHMKGFFITFGLSRRGSEGHRRTRRSAT